MNGRIRDGTVRPFGSESCGNRCRHQLVGFRNPARQRSPRLFRKLNKAIVFCGPGWVRGYSGTGI